MTTFLDLQTRVRTRLIDLPTAVAGEVNTLINEALRALQRRHNFKVMETVLQTTTLVGQRLLVATVPANFKEWRPTKPFYTTSLGTYRPVKWAADISGPSKVWTTVDVGEPRVVNFSDAMDETGLYSLGVWPLPDGGSDYPDGEYRLSLPYFKYVADLAANGDTNWFTNNATEYLINMAVANGFASDWDIQNSAIWEAKANNKFNEALSADKRLRLSGMTSFAYHLGAEEPSIVE